MYTTIPHSLLCSAIAAVTKEAFIYQYQQQHSSSSSSSSSDEEKALDSMRLVWSKQDGVVHIRWVSIAANMDDSNNHSELRAGAKYTKKARELSFSWNDLNKHIKWLVSNIYIENGGVIRRQKIGIPMGTNCAPPLANLFLYRSESHFIDRLVACGKSHTAREFHLTFRFIDDTLSIDNPHWQAAVTPSAKTSQSLSSSYFPCHLYPSQLTINDTTGDAIDNSVQFLGMTISPSSSSSSSSSVPHRFSLSVYDKRSSFPFTVRRYPQVSSLIPPTIPYGVWLAQLHRGYRICSSISAFVEFSKIVYDRLVLNGCTSSRLVRIFNQFVYRKTGSKFVRVSSLAASSSSHSHSHSHSHSLTPIHYS